MVFIFYPSSIDTIAGRWRPKAPLVSWSTFRSYFYLDRDRTTSSSRFSRSTDPRDRVFLYLLLHENWYKFEIRVGHLQRLRSLQRNNSTLRFFFQNALYPRRVSQPSRVATMNRTPILIRHWTSHREIAVKFTISLRQNTCIPCSFLPLPNDVSIAQPLSRRFAGFFTSAIIQFISSGPYTTKAESRLISQLYVSPSRWPRKAGFDKRAATNANSSRFRSGWTILIQTFLFRVQVPNEPA